MSLRFNSKKEFAEAILKHGKLYNRAGLIAECTESKAQLFTFNGVSMDGYWSNFSQEWSTTEPLKDKELVECWNEDSTHARTLRFWDAKNDKPFSRKGLRSGITWQNYRKITPLPEWAIEAQKTLEY